MKYALAVDDLLVMYPYDVRGENPNTSFPLVINKECLPDGVVEVFPTTPEEVEGYHPEEGTPELVEGQWFQTWTQVENPAPEEPA